MANILIISGSVYGTATVVAEDLKIALEKGGHRVTHQEGGDSSILADEQFDAALICTSTTGAGDIPANLATFHEELVSAPPRVTDLRYAVIALGDSSYVDSFCGAGLTLDQAMAEIGAARICPPLQIDAMEDFTPEDTAIAWVDDLLSQHLS
ncbi:MAG TPA: hypothetical protein DD979_03555 [Gammaproteobacteria bacterium]|jgi:flavodoxin|nr:hypothetical protein [Gammaproteobacteria bacterium]